MVIVQKDLEDNKITNKNLPPGWIKCELGQIFQLINGDRGKNYPSKSKLNTTGIPFIGALNIQNGTISNDKLLCVNQEQYDKLGSGKLNKGDTVLCIRGSLGKHARYPFEEGAIASSLVIIRNYCQENTLADFLSLYLDSSVMLSEIKKYNNGTAQPNLAASDLNKFVFPLPPLTEQKRIIKKIEELFSNIDSGVEKLEQAKFQLKQYKQSVLKSAFEGNLYKTTEWKQKNISDLVDVNPKTDIPSMKDDEDVSFLPMPAVKAEINFYIEEKAKFGKVKKGYTKFQDNDVLFAKITPCMENGKSCVVKDLKYGVGFGSTEFHILRCSEQLIPEFLFFFVVQKHFRKTAKHFMSGAVGQQRVQADYLKNTVFLLPSILEQQKIVEEIEKRFEVADILEKAVVEGLQKSKQLKQSILKKAFEGKLVPQDPNDEPANVLLERIKAEKDSKSKGKK